MKKNTFSFILVAVILFLYYNLNAQYSEKQSFNYNGVSYEIFIIKQDSTIAEKCSFVETTNSKGEKDFFSSYSNLPFFAITASIVDSTCKPLGLFINKGNKSGEINTNKQGSGSFYTIQPNGVFYINQDNEFNVMTTSDFIQTNIKPKLGIQNGPLLVNNGIINSLFTVGSKNKYIRCGVGICSNKDGRYLVFAKSNVPVTFYSFADLFLTKYKCYNALTLESGTNCSIHFPSHNSLKYNNKVKPCRYFVIDL